MKGILGSVQERSAPKPARQAILGARVPLTDAGHELSDTPRVTEVCCAEDHSKQPPGSTAAGTTVLGRMGHGEGVHQRGDGTGQATGTLSSNKRPGVAPSTRRRSRTFELMRDLQLSLQQPVALAEPGDFDFGDDEDDDAFGDANVFDAATVLDPAEAPHSDGAPRVPQPTDHAAAPISSGDRCSSVSTCALPHVSGPPSVLPATNAGGTGPGKRGSYKNVKGKFKPRPAGSPSSTAPGAPEMPACAPPSQYKEQAACTGVALHRERNPGHASSSGAPCNLPTSHDSLDSHGEATRGAKRRVAFGSCQMYEYDPELPPADSGEDDCVCEVPLLPEAADRPLQGLQHSFMSAPDADAIGRCWNVGGPRDDATCSHDAHTDVLARCGVVEGISGVIERTALGGSGLMCSETEAVQQGASICSHSMHKPQSIVASKVASTPPGARAVAADEGMCQEVTPVLYFDMHGQKSKGEMEGALRVTTAEALQLSEQDMAELRAQMHTGAGTKAEDVLDVQVSALCPLRQMHLLHPCVLSRRTGFVLTM